VATQEQTIQYAFDTRLTNLATDTTLAAATRYDAASVTLNIPENSSRTFLSVVLMVTWRDAFTAAASVTGWRLGIKLGAASFTDTDYSISQTNTGDHESGTLFHDVTSYFNTNFGSGTSQTCQFGFAMSTSAASNVNNIAGKLFITYQFSDTSQTTRVKTILIPIQSHHTTLTTSQVEVGTTGGTTNAPASQIPQLSTYLPENSVTIRQAFLEIFSNDLSGSGTGDITPIYQIDSASENNRAVLEEALGSSVYFHDIMIYDTGTFATSSTHAFKARADVTARMQNLGGWLAVTYEYSTTSTTTFLNQTIVPLLQPADGQTLWLNGDGNASSAQDYRAVIDIQAPGTITIKQSAVVMMVATNAASNTIVTAGGQSERTYNITSNTPYVGPVPSIHRTDHSTGWSLARGRNVLTFRARQSTESRNSLQGYAIVTYTSGVASAGVSAHSKTTTWAIANPAAAAQSRDVTTAITPVINPTNYVLQGTFVELWARMTAAAPAAAVWAAQQSGEWDAIGWMVTSAAVAVNSAELCAAPFMLPTTAWWNANSVQTGKANIETARNYRLEGVASSMFVAMQYVSYHGITYAVSGTLSNTAGAGSGIVVNVHRLDTGEIVNTATTTSGGAWSSVVFDDTLTYYATAREDSTHKGRTDNFTAPTTGANIDMQPPGGGGTSFVDGMINQGLN